MRDIFFCANDTIESTRPTGGSLRIGYLSPTAIVSELRHSLRARTCVSVSVCVFRGGWELNCDREKVQEVKERAGEDTKVSELQGLGG